MRVNTPLCIYSSEHLFPMKPKDVVFAVKKFRLGYWHIFGNSRCGGNEPGKKVISSLGLSVLTCLPQSLYIGIAEDP